MRAPGITAAVCVPYQRREVDAALETVREIVPDARVVVRRGAHWIIGTVPRGTTTATIAGLMSSAGIGALSIIVEGDA